MRDIDYTIVAGIDLCHSKRGDNVKVHNISITRILIPRT